MSATVRVHTHTNIMHQSMRAIEVGVEEQECFDYGLDDRRAARRERRKRRMRAHPATDTIAAGVGESQPTPFAVRLSFTCLLCITAVCVGAALTRRDAAPYSRSLESASPQSAFGWSRRVPLQVHHHHHHAMRELDEIDSNINGTEGAEDTQKICPRAHDFTVMPGNEQGGFLLPLLGVVYCLFAIGELQLSYLDPWCRWLADHHGWRSRHGESLALNSVAILVQVSMHFFGLMFTHRDIGIGVVIGAAITNLFIIPATLTTALTSAAAPIAFTLFWFRATRDSIAFCISVLLVTSILITTTQISSTHALIVLLVGVSLYAPLWLRSSSIYQWVAHGVNRSTVILNSTDPELNHHIGLIDFLEGNIFSAIINTLICLSVVCVVWDEFSGPDWLSTVNYFFSAVFILECLVKHLAYGLFGYWRDPVNAFDGVLVALIVFELLFSGGNIASSVRVVRLFRFLRAMRGMRAIRVTRGMSFRNGTFHFSRQSSRRSRSNTITKNSLEPPPTIPDGTNGSIALAHARLPADLAQSTSESQAGQPRADITQANANKLEPADHQHERSISYIESLSHVNPFGYHHAEEGKFAAILPSGSDALVSPVNRFGPIPRSLSFSSTPLGSSSPFTTGFVPMSNLPLRRSFSHGPRHVHRRSHSARDLHMLAEEPEFDPASRSVTVRDDSIIGSPSRTSTISRPMRVRHDTTSISGMMLSTIVASPLTDVDDADGYPTPLNSIRSLESTRPPPLLLRTDSFTPSYPLSTGTGQHGLDTPASLFQPINEGENQDVGSPQIATATPLAGPIFVAAPPPPAKTRIPGVLVALSGGTSDTAANATGPEPNRTNTTHAGQTDQTMTIAPLPQSHTQPSPTPQPTDPFTPLQIASSKVTPSDLPVSPAPVAVAAPPTGVRFLLQPSRSRRASQTDTVEGTNPQSNGDAITVGTHDHTRSNTKTATTKFVIKPMHAVTKPKEPEATTPNEEAPLPPAIVVAASPPSVPPSSVSVGASPVFCPAVSTSNRRFVPPTPLGGAASTNLYMVAVGLKQPDTTRTAEAAHTTPVEGDLHTATEVKDAPIARSTRRVSLTRSCTTIPAFSSNKVADESSISASGIVSSPHLITPPHFSLVESAELPAPVDSAESRAHRTNQTTRDTNMQPTTQQTGVSDTPVTSTGNTDPMMESHLVSDECRPRTAGDEDDFSRSRRSESEYSSCDSDYSHGSSAFESNAPSDSCWDDSDATSTSESELSEADLARHRRRPKRIRAWTILPKKYFHMRSTIAIVCLVIMSAFILIALVLSAIDPA